MNKYLSNQSSVQQNNKNWFCSSWLIFKLKNNLITPFTSVFHASVLLLITNFVITLSKQLWIHEAIAEKIRRPSHQYLALVLVFLTVVIFCNRRFWRCMLLHTKCQVEYTMRNSSVMFVTAVCFFFLLDNVMTEFIVNNGKKTPHFALIFWNYNISIKKEKKRMHMSQRCI